MAGRKSGNTRRKIIQAAWQLFYDQGYEATTIDDIIETSGTSRGSFYHYFEGKDALLGSLSVLFDEKYEELEDSLKEIPSYMDQLLFLNRELFSMIEKTVAVDILAMLFSTQLTTKGEKHLLDRTRYYFKLLRRIFKEGQDSGEFTEDMSVNELVKLYAVAERALMYDWCLCNGEYSLKKYAMETMPYFLERIKNKKV